MANLISVRLNKGDSPSWGFRLQGGKDFGTPLVVQKITGGSPAERAGLIAGDTVVRINNVDVYNLRHKDAQDVILRAGPSFEIAVQRGGSTWKPSVTPIGSVPTPRPAPVSNLSPVTATSLAAGRQENIGAIGTSHNVSAKPFQVNGVPKFVNKQYNSPLPLYSEQSIAETLSAQAEVLSNGVLGVNFKKNEKSYDAEKSAVFRMVQEADKEPRDELVNRSNFYDTHSHAIGGRTSGHPRRSTPTGDHSQSFDPQGTGSTRPEPEQRPNTADNQQMTKCTDCERVIVGVFVRIKDKNLHVECFKCATCGTSLKNVGYYNINNKLYCDVHAKLAARNNPPAPNLVPVTVPPGGKIPSGTISAALSSHSLPSPAPLSPSTNYSAAPYQPLNTSYSSPRPFSSVNAPVSPPSTLPKLSPIPSSTTPIAESRGIQNIVWPPIQNEPELPTASPLYFPPPSQVHIHQKSEESQQTEKQDYSELEEMSYITQHCDQNMSLCSAEVSCITGRRSVVECSETISDTIDTQILVESIVQNPPRLRSPPPVRPKSPPPPDVSVTFTISEADLKRGVYATTQAGLTECKTTASTETKACPLKETTQQQNVTSAYATEIGSKSSKSAQTTEVKTCSLKESRQQQTLASMYEKKIKVENTVPQKWESPMVVALTVAPDKPYTQVQTSTWSTEQKEVTVNDVFSQIPTKKSTTALASALAVAPSEPFTPINPITSICSEPVPLPKETVPYFPPEHPVIIESKTEIKSDEKKKSSETTEKRNYAKKKSKQDDELFKDLPTPPPQKISMLSALTTAPERPYSPFSIDAPLYKTEHLKENNPIPATTTHVKKDLHATADQKREKTTDCRSVSKGSAIATSSTKKTCLPYYSAYSTLHQTSAIEKDQSKSVRASSMEMFQKKQNVQQTLAASSSEQSKSAVVSKNIKTTEDIAQVSGGGMPPYIQMIRGSFETKTDKVQMEMSCQFPGPPIVKKEIIKKTSSTTDSVAEESHKRSIAERKEISQMSQMEAARSKSQMESASISQAKRSVFQESTTAADVSESALLQKATLQAKSDVQVQKNKEQLQKQVRSDTKAEIRCLETDRNTLRVPSKERVTVIQSGKTTLNVPEISFQPVSDEKPCSTSFSPRPKSLTPSMINKPAPIIPYYQASLVPIKCVAPETNVFDPTSPAVSRSPSPYPGRPSSPFPSSVGRAPSPAPGPPTNPLQTHKSAEQLIRESKMKEARGHIQSYIPQVQSRTADYQTQNVSGKIQQAYAETASSKKSVSGSTVMQRSEQQRQLLEKANLEKQSAEVVRDSAMQIQRKKKVTEEYEHTQRSKVIQIEKKSSDAKFCTSQIQAASSFHVTNPQPIKSSFISHGETSVSKSDTTEKVLQSDINRKSSLTSGVSKLPKAIPVSSGSCPSTSTSSTINVYKPNVSQPNAGSSGRQAPAIGVAPRRGRGILNLTAGPGARVPLCAQCHANIRGPFVTALGKIWCPDHFICATPSCRRALHDLGFVEERGQLYCEYCFEQYIAPPCAKCSAKVKGDCLKAIGKNFHPECFNCVYCGKLFGNSPFFLEDGQPYCEGDWNELFTTKCFACGFPVEAGDRWVEALNNNYHSQCFNCTMCKKNLEGQSFFAKGGRPFCKNHAR